MGDLPDLTSLPPDRATAVGAWLTSTLNPCRICGEPVTPLDSRIHDDDYKPPDAPPDETPEQEKQRTRPRVIHLAC
jgi:hypothetical protein